MNRFFSVLLAFAFTSYAASAFAQTRALGAHAFTLDDGSGNTITLETTLSGWTGNIPFVLPIPPPGSPPSGFVHIGTALNQILMWNPADGVQGAWDATTLTASGAITGTGTSGMIPLWTGTSTQGNSALAQNYINSGTIYSSTSSGEQLLATDAGATTAISIALQPKGTGALEAQIADNGTGGGNARGQYAVDWQMIRAAATEVASGPEATVSGGYENTASNYYATVSGGIVNTASGSAATVSGGYFNAASGAGFATVSGGSSNTASGFSATVSGGYLNAASVPMATVSGGDFNTASGMNAAISGGYTNTISGGYSAIPGGELLTLIGHDDFGFLGRNDARIPGNAMSIAANNTAVFGNTNLWLASNDGAAHGLYLFAPGSSSGAFDSVANKFVAFQSGVVTASQILTLPLAQPTTGQVLEATAVGGTEPYAVTLGWVTPGLSHITENYNNSTAPYSATSSGEQLLATDAGATNISIALQPKGAGALETQIADNGTGGGNIRGTNAVDWQMSRGANTQVASGLNSTISGGKANTASGDFSTVSGGFDAIASQYGQHAQASGDFASQGDAQTSVFTLRTSTSNAIATYLTLDGLTTFIAVPSSGAMNFHVYIIGKTSGSPATVGAWDVNGAIYNNAGTATIVGTNVTATYNAPAGWGTPTVTALNGNLYVQVTGAASTNIRWVARVETAEVTY